MLDRPPETQGWSTTDEQEIEIRRWRGRTEIEAIEVVGAREPVLGTFRVRSESGSSYDVEIRSLDHHVNSCGCIDHRVNGLGTCKHIEGVLDMLRRQRVAQDGPPHANRRLEVFLDQRVGATPVIAWPEGRRATQAVRTWLAPFLKADGMLRSEPAKVAELLKAWAEAPAHIRRQVRVSQHLAPWLERQKRQRSRGKAREAFLREVETGKASFDLTRLPLLPYQRDGMLHLAFGERALLADEMGLGKTVQAIAAAELLARRKGVTRVLVVCPASLKSEWEEQIARFTERPARSVFGPRQARLAAYREPSFFNIVNYEQVLAGAAEINALLAPDLVILDEAQRIKNWQTKTAREVKKLRSPYAFVLTGTPLENRIDELYSIVQYLDPELLGPLFRFNRDFYVLELIDLIAEAREYFGHVVVMADQGLRHRHDRLDGRRRTAARRPAPRRCLPRRPDRRGQDGVGKVDHRASFQRRERLHPVRHVGVQRRARGSAPDRRAPGLHRLRRGRRVDERDQRAPVQRCPKLSALEGSAATSVACDHGHS